MEEMSYVFSFTFFSLPLIFTLHWWPLAIPILSPPLPNRYKSEKTRPVKRARESGEDEDYEAPPPSPLPSPSLCSLRSPISFQFHPVFCLFPPLRSLVPGQCYNGFTIKINVSSRDSKMEGVPAKILVPATLMQVSLWWWLPYVDIPKMTQ